MAALRDAGCVYAEDEADVIAASAAGPEVLASMVRERCTGVPLEHVVGWAEIAGVRVHVDRGVFVPRRRSELLVREAIRCCRPGSLVLDLCCGSGALGAAVAAAVDVDLHAADIDPAAVACARRNVPVVHQGDLFAALPHRLRGRVDVLLCNAPYVPTAEIAHLPAEARDHEPGRTLDGGNDGLGVHRRLAAEAPSWLADRGVLLTEVGPPQADPARTIFSAYDTRIVRDDALGATVLVAEVQAKP